MWQVTALYSESVDPIYENFVQIGQNTVGFPSSMPKKTVVNLSDLRQKVMYDRLKYYQNVSAKVRKSVKTVKSWRKF